VLAQAIEEEDFIFFLFAVRMGWFYNGALDIARNISCR
jgi:hypothetical protein